MDNNHTPKLLYDYQYYVTNEMRKQREVQLPAICSFNYKAPSPMVKIDKPIDISERKE